MTVSPQSLTVLLHSQQGLPDHSHRVTGPTPLTLSCLGSLQSFTTPAPLTLHGPHIRFLTCRNIAS